MTVREGSLEAPTRHPLDWRNPDFYDEGALDHGARARLRHLPRLPPLREPVQRVSDAVRPRSTRARRGELDGVAKADFGKVVDQCYLCDVCFMTKCPYVPPHPWNVDFPHLMLRAKAVRSSRKGERPLPRPGADVAPTAIGKLATIPVVVQMVNAASATPSLRKIGEQSLGVAAERQAAALCRAAVPRARQPRRCLAGPRRRAHAGQGRDLRDLLRQLQRARHRPRPAQAPRAQRDSVSCSSRRKPAAACRSSNWAISRRSRS